MSSGFIRHENRKGKEYVSVYRVKRVNGKKVNDTEYLGRVIDKENGIFISRDRGVFRFNGDISNEARPILLVDKKSSLPLYFRYAAGNIVDVSTLKTTLTELKAFGIDVDYAIIDADYYFERNAKELSESSISFIMRLVPNRKLYKELIEKHTADLEDARNLIKYRDRLIYIKRV